MALMDVGLFHRLGIATRGDGETATRRIVELMGGELLSSLPEPGDTHLTTMVRVGANHVALFVAEEDDTEGTIARYVDRYGAGLHSLAWRIADLEAAESAVQERGMTVTGVNREARHWFLHPKETFGILVELTDQAKDAQRLPPGAGAIRGIAWMTAVVNDVEAPRALFEGLFGAVPVEGLPAGPDEHETTVDLGIGDVVLRLVAVRSSASRYASASRQGLYSLALDVRDLGAVPLPVVERDGSRAWSDPADSLGVRLEWVARDPAV